MAQLVPNNVVKALTLANERLDPPVDQQTHNVYIAIVRRLAQREADGIPSHVARDTYDQYTSALTYVAAWLVEPIFRKVLAGQCDLTVDEEELLAAAERILQAYTRDGDLRAPTRCDGRLQPNPERPGKETAGNERAYRDAAHRVVRSPHYQRGNFWRAVRDCTEAPEPIAVCLITGTRNKELASGVEIRHGDDWPSTFEIFITGAKTSPAHGRGLPYRVLLFETGHDIDTPLGYLEHCLAAYGRHEVRISESGLRATVRQAARATFRTPLAERVTPYVLRHVAAGRLRRRRNRRTAAIALGHRGRRSVYAYYNGDDAGPVPIAVYSAELQPGYSPGPAGPSF